MAINTVQFLRNAAVVSGYEAAVAKLNEKWAELSDGSPIVIRYTEGEGDNVTPKALFAIKNGQAGSGNAPFVVLDSNAKVEEIEASVKALADQVAKELGESGSVAAAIAALKEELLGNASEGYQSLGALEGKIKAVEAAAKSYSVAAIEGEDLAALGENVKEAFKLVDEDGVQAGQTIKIYKDSALKSVALEEQELKFTYILANGEESTVGVDVSKFLAESEFGDGLEVVSGVVKVNVGESVEENKNFLEVEEDGDLKALAVRSIDTNATVLQQPITVAGLSGQFGAGNYSNDQVIPAGTDVYTILQNILCKELYPTTVSSQTGTAGAAMNNLTLTLDKSSTIEVGTLVKMTAGKTNGSTTSGVKNSKVYNMTYGYSAANDNSKDTADTAIEKTTSTSVSDNTYKISAALTGFTADANTYKQNVPATVSGTGSASMAETNLGCAIEGDNKIKLSATGASYSFSAEKIDSVYYCSNLGKTSSAKTSPSVAAVSSTTSKPTKTAEATVAARYKYFIGYSDNTKFSEFDSDAVRGLTAKSDWVTKDGDTAILDDKTVMKSNGKSIVIACPSKYKLKSITNGVGADIMDNFTTKGSEGTVSVKTGEINTTYKVYVYPITNGAVVEFKNLTLTKA